VGGSCKKFLDAKPHEYLYVVMLVFVLVHFYFILFYFF